MYINKVYGWKRGAWIHSKSLWKIHRKSWELQLFGIEDRKYWRRHPSVESTSLGSMSQASKSVDIWSWQKHQDQALHSHGWIDVTLWHWNMDNDKDADQENRQCLYKDVWMALNISWKRCMTNEELYGDLPRVSSKTGIRRIKLAGHARYHEEFLLNKLVLWNLLHGRRLMQSWNNERDGNTWSKAAWVDKTHPDDYIIIGIAKHNAGFYIEYMSSSLMAA